MKECVEERLNQLLKKGALCGGHLIVSVIAEVTVEPPARGHLLDRA